MGKTIVKNQLGQKVHSIYLPCDDIVATTFCSNFLDGEYVGYSEESVVGTDVATAYREVSLMIRNEAGYKAYLNLAVKTTISEEDIYTALAGLTFNNVKADHMAVLKMKSVSLA